MTCRLGSAHGCPAIAQIAFVATLWVAAAAGNLCRGQEKADPAAEAHPAREIRAGLEELNATGNDRHIRTTNLDLLYRFWKLDRPYFKLYGGITVSRALGTITQTTGSLAAGTLGNTTFDSGATGAGPVLAGRAEFLRRGNLSASVDGSLGVLWYDRDFPAGGSRYEFMWRLGPAISYSFTDRQTLSVVYTGMHVSNGQGESPHNPTYNAKGLGVQFLCGF
jgi:lipid A 3-O-deacylase